MPRFLEDQAASAYRLDNAAEQLNWVLPAETPIGFIYNKHNHAVMMATPSDLHDFAVGFSLAEGILHQPSEMIDLNIHEKENGIELHIEIPPKRFEKLQMHGARRAIRGRAGCGICGVDALSDAVRPLPRFTEPIILPTSNAIRRAVDHLPQAQEMRARNHTVHGAAWANAIGELQWVREDIGRHNALDKMIGAWAIALNSNEPGFALLSSRCTYELVQKCALAGIQTLVCLAAPTLGAVETAKKANMGLCIHDRKTGGVLVFHPAEPKG